MSRHTKLTPQISELLTSQLRLGMYIDESAAVAGIDKDTLHEWLRRGAREAARRERPDHEKMPDHEKLMEREQPFVEFSAAVKTALAHATSSMLGVVTRAAIGGAVIETHTTTRELPDGSKETTVVERKAKPEWTAAAWRLERKSPARWGRRLEFMEKSELPTDEELSSGLDAVDRLKEKLLAMRAAKQSGTPDKKPNDKKPRRK